MEHLTITLCGSMVFKDEFIRITNELTLKGVVVLNPIIWSKMKSNEYFSKIDSSALDSTIAGIHDTHNWKIDMSDAIYVINKDGYIGEDTQREIKYAEEKGKMILYLEDKHTTNCSVIDIPEARNPYDKLVFGGVYTDDKFIYFKIKNFNTFEIRYVIYQSISSCMFKSTKNLIAVENPVIVEELIANHNEVMYDIVKTNISDITGCFNIMVPTEYDTLLISNQGMPLGN